MSAWSSCGQPKAPQIPCFQSVPGGMTGQDGLMDEVLRDHRLAEAMRRDDDDVFALRQKLEGEDAFDGRPMDRLRPVPFPIGHGLEAAEARVSETPFDALPQAGLEFRLHESFELHNGTPALLRGAGEKVIELVSGVQQPQLAELITQCRRNRIGRGHRKSPSDAG